MKKRILFGVSSILAVMLLGLVPGCSRPRGPLVERQWIDLVKRLADPSEIARLDPLPTHIVTSVDPTGRNDDYNNPVRKGKDGWFVIADLEGPGYVSRFWLTGPKDGVHGLRFYFDGEKTPRIDTTVGEWCGGMDPFLPPVAIHESFGWYSYVPIPFEESLVIEVEPGGTEPGNWPRIFHQVNYQLLPEGETIKSMPAQVPADIAAAIEEVREAWSSNDFGEPKGESQTFTLNLEAGESGRISSFPGPAIIRELRIRPDWDALAAGVEREELLQDVVMSISWDDAAQPSVQVPLSEFFGGFWRPTRFQSMFVGMEDDAFYCRFPMPFAKQARIGFDNNYTSDVKLSIEARVEPVEVKDPDLGYFHATWQSTSPRELGRPHPILRTQGRGRIVGCFLSVVTLDKSWWILEGDETIRIDGEQSPSWKGTGLEDYFNGAWYYQNVIDHPLNGLTFKAPFRTVQYRFHLPDPILFSESVDMLFERGPDQASHGWMESVGYYYLDAPRSAQSRINRKRSNQRPRDPLANMTLMYELLNLERQDDAAGAVNYMDAYVQRYPDFPFKDVLEARKLSYREKEEGFEAVKPAYEALVESTTNELAKSQIEKLLWFQEEPNRALLSLFCNTPTRVFIDGQVVAEVGHPEKLEVVPLELTPGRHTIALQARWKQYPDWVQAHLRMHGGELFTTPDWRFAFDARGDWHSNGYDDSGWKTEGGTGVKGPPEVPYVWVEPNAMVDVQSKAVGLRPGPRDKWPNKQGYIVYRREFEVP